MNHADSYEEIKPLVELCKAGRLFDVQEWIAPGRPVNLPLEREKKARGKSPLKIAMEKGFHSLVQVLVEGGARIDEEGYSALSPAISERRLDLIELLVENGAYIHNQEWVLGLLGQTQTVIEGGPPMAYAGKRGRQLLIVLGIRDSQTVRRLRLNG